MRRLAWLFFAGLVVACSNESTGPTGALQVTLDSPNNDDGAVLFTIVGGPVDSVVPVNDQIYSARSNAKAIQVIATGNIGNGTIARIYVPDIRLTAKYSATVKQVAARGSYVQHDPASYTVSIAP
jgi:hypothetical protein